MYRYDVIPWPRLAYFPSFPRAFIFSFFDEKRPLRWREGAAKKKKKKKNDRKAMMHVQSCCLIYLTYCFFDVVVAVVDKRLQNMILTIFKCLHFSDYPRYLKDMFRLRSSTYFLRGHIMLCLPKPLTTSYGINSFSYLAATSWNSLPDHYRTISDFTSFRRLISTGNNNLLKRAGTANLSTS